MQWAFPEETQASNQMEREFVRTIDFDQEAEVPEQCVPDELQMLKIENER